MSKDLFCAPAFEEAIHLLRPAATECYTLLIGFFFPETLY